MVQIQIIDHVSLGSIWASLKFTEMHGFAHEAIIPCFTSLYSFKRHLLITLKLNAMKLQFTASQNIKKKIGSNYKKKVQNISNA